MLAELVYMIAVGAERRAALGPSDEWSYPEEPAAPAGSVGDAPLPPFALLELFGGSCAVDAAVAFLTPTPAVRSAASLDLSACLGLGSRSLAALVRTCRLAARLELRGLPSVDLNVCRAIAMRLPRLVRLDLGSCKGVDDACCRALAAGLRRHGTLKLLSLANCSAVTDAGAKAIGEGLSALLVDVCMYGCCKSVSMSPWCRRRRPTH